MNREPKSLLLVGVNGGIGNALLKLIHQRYPESELMTLSHTQMSPISQKHHPLTIDMTKSASVNQLVAHFQQTGLVPERIIQCSGMLHKPDHLPEKTISQLNANWLHELLDVNVLSHVHVAQAIDQAIPRTQALIWLSISAQIASIEDNHLGGWYSYRMTKAALNMWIKTLSIEWQLKRPGSCVIAFHPGTTETPLSKPFQAGIPAHQLHTAKQTANNLLDIMSTRSPKDTGQFFNYRGEYLPW